VSLGGGGRLFLGERLARSARCDRNRRGLLFGFFPPEHENVADVLHRRTPQGSAYFAHQRIAILPFDPVEFYLDEFVGRQCPVDLVQDGRRKPVLPEAGDGMEVVGGGAQRPALGGCQSCHGGILTVTLKSKRHKKSKAWMNEHVHDPYVLRAKAEGWRSRAVFKLKEIDDKDRLLKPGMTVVDLGAAPGSWCEYAARRIQPGGRLIALDMLPMEPIPGVVFIQGDFREESTLRELESALGGRQADLVLSDMAPNISGIAATDQARMEHLMELALDFAAAWLRPGGDLLVKIFQGSGFIQVRKTMEGMFESLSVRKPSASRDRSAETYLLARGRLK